MKQFASLSLVAAIAVTTVFTSCEKTSVEASQAVPSNTLAKIESLGFNVENAHKFTDPSGEAGYIVEGDIFLTEEYIANEMSAKEIVPGIEEEHYSTNNLVTGLPRTVKVYVDPNFSNFYVQATDIAIDRYNAENLDLQFTRVTSNGKRKVKADINIVAFYEGPSGGYITLGSAGFPTRRGKPYNKINLNTYYYDTFDDVDALATTIAHEMGHCIGFRHTDYMDRSFSCGGSYANEGAAGIGANHIPGTPTGPENGSWMLSCSSGDNPFSNNDKTALDYLY
ncbi:MAG: M57 family metalloprotease [Reichenbachiella sp.]|uniref:M57 family metalloprotease n=1 Tax=Reichenbachiella sp. TaxID=2184521 RepID=UPI003296D08B